MAWINVSGLTIDVFFVLMEERFLNLLRVFKTHFVSYFLNEKKLREVHSVLQIQILVTCVLQITWWTMNKIATRASK